MKPLVEATVADQTGIMKVTFFNQPWLERRYRPGTRLMLQGKYQGRNRFRVQFHAETGELVGATGDVATYPATEGLSTTQIAALVHDHRAALPTWSSRCPRGSAPPAAGPTAPAALGAAHFGGGELGRGRLAFEELLLLQLAMLRRRRALRREAARADDARGAAVADRAAGSPSRSRSRRPTTSARRWRRSTRTSRAGARCSGC